MKYEVEMSMLVKQTVVVEANSKEIAKSLAYVAPLEGTQPEGILSSKLEVLDVPEVLSVILEPVPERT